jgi:hypothetical protein
MTVSKQRPLGQKMMEVNDLLEERDSYETKGVDNLNDYEYDNYYKISDRIRELIGSDQNVQNKIEFNLERRFGRRF